MSIDVTKFKPGQDLECTVEKLPRSQDDTDTIARLMRLDPANKKALRTAYRMRKQRMVIYNRGNRDWVKREPTAKVVRVEAGANWTLPFSVELGNDIKAIAEFISIKSK
jgi:hypothetical protein